MYQIGVQAQHWQKKQTSLMLLQDKSLDIIHYIIRA